MSGSVNRQILLVEKPSGKLGPEHFKICLLYTSDAADE